MEGSTPTSLDSPRDREARTISGCSPSPRAAPWKFLKTLDLGQLGLWAGPRAVIEQGVHLCTLQPQAPLGLAEQCPQ